MTTFFSRIIAIILSIFALISGGNPDKVITRIDNQMTTETAELEYTIENYTGRQITFGIGSFKLEKKEEGKGWVELPINDDLCFIEVVIILKNTQRNSQSLDLEMVYGHKLEEGHYRFTKYVTCDDYGNVSSSAEFDVIAK